MAAAPTSITLRTYQVGFGDCFLLSFNYGESPAAKKKHVLIDFGSTGAPKKSKVDLLKIAEDIRKVSEGKLAAVVATHRHADHISGFGGKPGEIIAGLDPDVVLQPWTEDPEASPTARRPTAQLRAFASFRVALDDMHGIAAYALRESRSVRGSATLKAQLAFLGEENLKNLPAVRTLMDMKGKHVYAYYGRRSGLESVLPGVKVRVLGPPTLEQSEAIEKQRAKDPAEFWHFQALAVNRGVGLPPALFKRAARARASALPFETRWFLPRLDGMRGEQLLELVRILDKAMNNTSLILLFEVGGKTLLFPGDAQIENWLYALRGAPDSAKVCERLSQVDVYKVGHHGSLNATPKTLWGLFKKKGNPGRRDRLESVVSTMAGKHGSEDRSTEVPRATLMAALEENSDLFTTQRLTTDICKVSTLQL